MKINLDSQIKFKPQLKFKNIVRKSFSNIGDSVSFTSKGKTKITVADFNKKLAAINTDTNSCSTGQILDCLKINYDTDENGKFILYQYNQPGASVRFSDYKINEDKLLNDISEIRGDAFFINSNAKSLGAVKYIEGNAYFQKSKLKNLGELEFIGKSAYFSDSKITSLDNLAHVGEDINISNSKINNLGKLKNVEGSAFLHNSDIMDLGELEYIGGDLWIDSTINSIGNLKYVGGKVYIN